MAERALKDQRSILCTRARALSGTKNITNRNSYLFSHLSNKKGHCINKISKMREVIKMIIQRHKMVIRLFQKTGIETFSQTVIWLEEKMRRKCGALHKPKSILSFQWLIFTTKSKQFCR